MNIQDFCVQMNRSTGEDAASAPSEPSLKALQKLQEIDLQALLAKGAMAGYWDIWDDSQNPLITTALKAV